MVAIRLLKLKLELKYSKKLKLYKTILIHGVCLSICLCVFTSFLNCCLWIFVV